MLQTYLLHLGQCVIVLLNLALLIPVVDLQQVAMLLRQKGRTQVWECNGDWHFESGIAKLAGLQKAQL